LREGAFDARPRGIVRPEGRGGLPLAGGLQRLVGRLLVVCGTSGLSMIRSSKAPGTDGRRADRQTPSS
jgi:hypothetical protein